jgi:hypothetical protein
MRLLVVIMQQNPYYLREYIFRAETYLYARALVPLTDQVVTDMLSGAWALSIDNVRRKGIGLVRAAYRR